MGDLADVGDVPFLIGPVFGPVIAAAAVVILLAMKRSAAVIVLASTCAVAVAGSFLAYWYVWGLGFDDADAGRPVSSTVETVSDAAITTSATGVLALLALLLVVSARRTARP